MDKYGIDTHKLMYHPKRVAEWKSTGKCYPIYAEMSPCNHCNHRCNFCSFEFTGYKKRELDTDVWKKAVESMADVGVKAIMYAGEGEPLLHQDISDMVVFTKQSGIDVAMTSNGVLMDKEFSDKCLQHMSWIKISVDAWNYDTYAQLHGTNGSDLDRVFDNLHYAVKVKSNSDCGCAIGTQAILFPENADEMAPLANHLKSIGVDYFVIKPFTGHQYRTGFNGVDYGNIPEELHEEFKDDPFVIFRKNTFDRMDIVRDYEACHALNFWTYIDSLGDVYSCSNFLGNKDYVYGNLHEHSFKDIWDNKSKVYPDIHQCREICRMDKVNKYLWDLKHGKEHVNFI